MEIRNKAKLLSNSPSYRGARLIAMKAAEIGLRAVDPQRIVAENLVIEGDTAKIGGLTFDLASFRDIYVIGFGKASGLMAKSVEKLLGSRIKAGIVVVPRGGNSPKLRQIRVVQGDHPIPSYSSIRATEAVLDFMTQVTSEDLVFFLISGGGSSLLVSPSPGITLENKKAVNRLLLESGATIQEINTVRKHLSRVKGGQLARRAGGATIVSLIISDVVGDPVDSIASGPMSPDHSTFADAVAVLKKYDLWRRVPAKVAKTLKKGVDGGLQETPKLGDKIFNKVQNVVVANPSTACYAASEELKKAGLRSIVLTSRIEGISGEISSLLASVCREVVEKGNPVQKPCALIVGGETTVRVVGTGKGGRNQESALFFSEKISGVEGVSAVFIGTDGADGPTDAAGAIADSDTHSRAKVLRLDAEDYLKNNDSYNYFKQLGDLVFTGQTGTNVGDLWIAVVL